MIHLHPPRSSRDDRPRHRVISVSFRLPRNDHRLSARQQLFESDLPPKAALSLQDSVCCPFICVGSDPPEARSDPDVPKSHIDVEHIRTQRPRPTTSRPRQPQSQNQPRHSSHGNVHVPLPRDPLVMQRFHIFCEHILWRLLHYDYASLDDPNLMDYWNAYREVNSCFAEALADICEEGDLIWVHNFHLMLLPAMLRETVWYAKIGFFLYTPFPSAELFRILPHRMEILQGVMGADVIGFHSYDHAKQFVTSCRRLLGLEATPSEIVADPHSGRTTKVGIYPGGIDVVALQNHVASKLVKSRVAELRARFEGLKIVVGVDRLDDCFAGLFHKLLAFEQLLADNAHLVGKVILVQAAMLPKQARNAASYRAQRVQLNECVARVNSAFGTWSYSPIHFINAPLSPTELHALMCVGHVCVVTTVRDGMGLVPHEWTVCQHGSYNGAIVLSEFASAANSFSTALHVNPWDIDEIAAKIKVALEMGDASRLVRNEAAFRFVTSHTAQAWGTNFLDDLESVDKGVAAARARNAGKPSLDTTALMHAYLGTALLALPTMSFSSLASNRNIASSPHLVYGEQVSNAERNVFSTREPLGSFCESSLVDAGSRPGESSGAESGKRNGSVPLAIPKGTRANDGWGLGDSSPTDTARGRRRTSRACLFVMDIEGVLVNAQGKADAASVPRQVMDVIQALVDASVHNYVLVISSRGRQSLLDVFDGMRVFLAAEDGAFFHAPGAAGWLVLFRDSALQEISNGRRGMSTGDLVGSSEQGLGSGSKSVSPESDGERNGGGVFCNTECDGNETECVGEDGVRVSTKASMSSHTSFSSVEVGVGEYVPVVSWKEIVMPAMQHFAERTHGAVLEEGEAIVTWHYGEVDAEFGQFQARQVCKHMQSFVLRGLGITVVADEERRWIRVRPKDSDKSKAMGQMVKQVLSVNVRHAGDDNDSDNDSTVAIDFVLSFGGDRGSEGLFELLRDKIRMERLGVHCGANRVFTCRVGGGRTAAGCRLDGPLRVVQVLEVMCGKQAWAML